MLLRKCLVALGLASAMAIATTAPMLAEGANLQRPAVGVDIGRSGRGGVDIDRPRYPELPLFHGQDDGSIRTVRCC